MPQRRLATNTVFSPSGRWPPLTPLLLPSTAGETTHQKRKLLLGKDDPHVQGRPLIALSSPFPTQPLLPSLLTPNLMGFTASPPAALPTLLLSDKAPVPFTWHTRTAPPHPPPFFSAPDRLGGSDGKASAYNAGDPGSIPGSGRSPGEGNGNPLQYSCLENPMDGGAWWATIHGVAKCRTRLSDFTFHFPGRSVRALFLCTPLPRRDLFSSPNDTPVSLSILTLAH